MNDNEYLSDCFLVIVNYLSTNDLVQLSSVNRSWKTILNEFRIIMIIDYKSRMLLTRKSNDNNLFYHDNSYITFLDHNSYQPTGSMNCSMPFKYPELIFTIDYRPKCLQNLYRNTWYPGKRYINPTLEDMIKFITIIENSNHNEIIDWLWNINDDNNIMKWCDIHKKFKSNIYYNIYKI
jgi:hypothetical protein